MRMKKCSTEDYASNFFKVKCSRIDEIAIQRNVKIVWLIQHHVNNHITTFNAESTTSSFISF